VLRELSLSSEGFAYGCTALASALHDERRVVIAASLTDAYASSWRLSCWSCAYDEHGIALQSMSVALGELAMSPAWGASRIIGHGGAGDVLIACDPWGENDLLCWALRLAPARGVTTIAVTADHPNLLAALAGHAVRVPATPATRRAYVIAALQHIVQTAGTSLVPVARRMTGPLRAVEIA
jgi:hypothetical protein